MTTNPPPTGEQTPKPARKRSTSKKAKGLNGDTSAGWDGTAELMQKHIKAAGKGNWQDTLNADIKANPPPPDEWPDPLPLTTVFAGSDRAEAALMALAGPTARAEIDDKVRNLKTPRLMAIMGTYCSVAALAQGLFDVRHPETLLRTPLSMYAVLIATASERKTTSDAVGFGAIVDYEEKEREDYAKRQAEHALALDVWKAQRKKLMGERTHAKDDAEKAAIMKQLEDLGPEPKLHRHFPFRVEDTTKEALQDSYGSRFSRYLTSGEGTKVFGAYALSQEQSGGTFGLWNDLWNGIVGSVERTGRTTHDKTEGRLSLWVQVHPDFLFEFLRAQGSMMKAIGVLSRIGMVWPVTTKGTRLVDEEKGETDWAGRDRHQRALAALTRALLAGEGRGSRPQLIVSPAARKVWAKFHNEVERKMGPRGTYEESSEAAGKTAEHAVRLAALAWVMDELEHPEHITADIKPHISKEQMQRGCDAARALLDAQIEIVEAADERMESNNAVDLEQWLAKPQRAGRATLQEMRNSGPAHLRRKVRGDDPLENALEVLRERRRVFRTGMQFELHPALVKVAKVAKVADGG